MTEKYYTPTRSHISDGFARDFKNRIRLLILFSTLTVAVVFGMSFYFGLVSGGTAITNQFPELAPIVGKLKSLLLMNTFGFTAIIVASFYLLTRLITSRMFTPLADIQKNVIDLSEGKLNPLSVKNEPGPFSSLTTSYTTMLNSIRTAEEEDIAALSRSLRLLSSIQGCEGVSASISDLIERKNSRLGGPLSDNAERKETIAEEDNDLFMQPS